MSPLSHLSLQSLAALAEGRLRSGASGRARSHLARCPACLEAYATAAEACLRPEGAGGQGVPPLDLVALGRAVARAPSDTSTAAAGARPRGAEVLRPVTRPLWAAATGVAVAAAALVLLSRPSREAAPRAELAGVALASLQTACRDMSAYLPGALVLPGGEDSAGSEFQSDERSGGRLGPDETATVEATVDALENLEGKGGPASPELAYWLGVGYLAIGDLTTARIHLDQSLRRFPDRVDLLLLDAVRANRGNELDRAEKRLRQVLALRPDHALARLNLGLLLAREERRRDESAALLGPIAHRGGGPLAQRALRALDELTARERAERPPEGKKESADTLGEYGY